MSKKTVSTATVVLAQLSPPHWLSPSARVVWDKKLSQARETGVQETIDSEMLAILCDAMAKRAELLQQNKLGPGDQRVIWRYGWIIRLYCDLLGFEPSTLEF